VIIVNSLELLILGVLLFLVGYTTHRTNRYHATVRGIVMQLTRSQRTRAAAFAVMLLGLVLLSSGAVVAYANPPAFMSDLLNASGRGGNSGFSQCNPPFVNLVCVQPGNAGINRTNIAHAAISSQSTTQVLYVSTGAGVTMSVENSGSIEALASVNCYTTGAGADIELDFAIYYSSSGIPSQGTQVPAGDVKIGEGLATAHGATLDYTVSIVGWKTGATNTFFVYVAFDTSNSADPNLIFAPSNLVVQEL
jgi:hypothetical protein